jgi:hypothetical protein
MAHPVGDIAAALAYQIKKEIAENYFGTRKGLEEERQDLLLQGKELQKSWDQEVLPLLNRIDQLLLGDQSGRAFWNLIGRGDLFTGRKSVQEGTGTKPKVISCSPPFAMTVRGKYKKLIVTFYRMAIERGAPLFQKHHSLQKRVDLFNEELIRFQSSCNLLEVLSFIKSLENLDDLKGVLGNNSDPRTIPALEEKLLIKPLDLAGEGGEVLRTLPPLMEIQRPLEGLIDQTFQIHCSEIKKRLGEGTL